MNRNHPLPFACPVCGEEVPARALACPGCGADEKTGWDPVHTSANGLNLPDEDFDYDDFLKKNFAPPRPWASWRWWVMAIVVAALAVGLLVLLT